MTSEEGVELVASLLREARRKDEAEALSWAIRCAEEVLQNRFPYMREWPVKRAKQLALLRVIRARLLAADTNPTEEP